MPDLTRGHTFTSGEEVDHNKLNNLVGNAIINNGSIDSDAIASNAVTNDKISASAGINLTKLENVTSGRVIIGNSTNIPTAVALSGDVTVSSSGVTSIGNDKVVTDKILDANVTTAKIADDAVTADKLADTAVTAGSYTNASVTVDAQGRVTAASSGAAQSTPVMKVAAITTTGSTQTWTAPAGVTNAKFTLVGGGSGYVANTGSGSNYFGGGSGAICIVSATVTPSTSYNIVIGAGGAAVNNPQQNSGGDTTLTIGSTTYTAGGGQYNNSANAGVGGTATNGDINISGVNGAGSSGDNAGGFWNNYGAGGGRDSIRSEGFQGIAIIEWLE